MKIFILILIVNSAYGKAVDHIEFPTKEACVNAAETIRKDKSGFSNVYFYCVPKNDKQPAQ